MQYINIYNKGSLVTIYFDTVIYNKQIMKYQYFLNGLEVAVSDELIEEQKILLLPTLNTYCKNLFFKLKHDKHL